MMTPLRCPASFVQVVLLVLGIGANIVTEIVCEKQHEPKTVVAVNGVNFQQTPAVAPGAPEAIHSTLVVNLNDNGRSKSSVTSGGHPSVGSNEADQVGELVFVTALFRHGDRTPVETYPTDPYGGAEFWPEGWGQLTNIGKQHHFDLGRWLRHRYNNTAVLQSHYNASDIYVRSTDYDRTLMSATVNMAALYSPFEDTPSKPAAAAAAASTATSNPASPASSATAAWLRDPHWLPVPVHTVPQSLDDTLLNEIPCARYDQLFEEVKRTHVVPLLQKHQHLIRYLEEHSGKHVGDDLWQVNNLHDTLFIEELRNLTLPAWTSTVWPGSGEFRTLSDQAFVLETQTTEMGRLKYGRLLGEILQRLRNKTDGTLVPNRSMWVYSAHDTTLSGVLNTMGMFEPVHAPPYASVLLWELRMVTGRPHVQMLYRRGWATADMANRNKAVVLEIPMCGKLCPLERMFELFAHVIPTGSVEEECQVVKEGKMRKSMRSAAVATRGLGGEWGLVLMGIVAGVYIQWWG